MQKIFQQVEDMEAVPTVHGEGTKRIFATSHETQTSVTQFAYGKLEQGEKIAPHRHAGMEEFFYFTGGSGEFIIDNKSFSVREGSFIRVPALAQHELQTNGSEGLQFVYFGAAVIDN
ncbi:MAG TPA: cupin domain-containing protein [Chitinophagaceae bacterium]|nr:cupin domain-containing protein [Chitinophagaceae bacterium]